MEFIFPEIKLKFFLTHGDVLLFKLNSIYHYTRRLQSERRQFEIALFQKSSLFCQLHKLKEEKCLEFYDKETKEKYMLNLKEYEEKKKIYIREREAGQISLSMI